MRLFTQTIFENVSKAKLTVHLQVFTVISTGTVHYVSPSVHVKSAKSQCVAMHMYVHLLHSYLYIHYLSFMRTSVGNVSGTRAFVRAQRTLKGNETS